VAVEELTSADGIIATAITGLRRVPLAFLHEGYIIRPVVRQGPQRLLPGKAAAIADMV
jgi:hypothetical protein